MRKDLEDMIRLLRESGRGYRMIAYELGLARGEVRAFCRANGLAGDVALSKENMGEWYAQHGRCMVCGKQLSRAGKGRRRRFCSGKCRTEYWREKHEEQE